MIEKIVLITGASKGLGYYLAKEYNKKKYKLILVSRTVSEVVELDGIKINLDLMKKNSVKSLCNYLVKSKLIPDIIIHNLGGKIEGDKHPINLNILKETMRLNVEIPIKINNSLLPRMLKKKNSKIIHISSDSSLTGKASPCYVIAKSSLNAYVLNLAGELKTKDISLHALLLEPFTYKNSYWYNLKYTNPKKYNDKKNTLGNKDFSTAKGLAKKIFIFSINKEKIANSMVLMSL